MTTTLRELLLAGRSRLAARRKAEKEAARLARELRQQEQRERWAALRQAYDARWPGLGLLVPAEPPDNFPPNDPNRNYFLALPFEGGFLWLTANAEDQPTGGIIVPEPVEELDPACQRSPGDVVDWIQGEHSRQDDLATALALAEEMGQRAQAIRQGQEPSPF
jgi:hypothetical protein